MSRKINSPGCQMQCNAGRILKGQSHEKSLGGFEVYTEGNTFFYMLSYISNMSIRGAHTGWHSSKVSCFISIKIFLNFFHWIGNVLNKILFSSQYQSIYICTVSTLCMYLQYLYSLSMFLQLLCLLQYLSIYSICLSTVFI